MVTAAEAACARDNDGVTKPESVRSTLPPPIGTVKCVPSTTVPPGHQSSAIQAYGGPFTPPEVAKIPLGPLMFPQLWVPPNCTFIQSPTSIWYNELAAMVE